MNKSKIIHITSAHFRDDTRIYYKQIKSLVNSNYNVKLIINDNEPSFINENFSIMATERVFQYRRKRFFFSII